MLTMAILVPVLGAVYIAWQIHKRDLRGWQHYACLTALIFLVSIMFLVGSGRVESFGLAGNTVKVVDQKLEEMRSLTERNKRIAQETVTFVNRATTGLVAFEGFDPKLVDQSATNLLRAAGLSDQEIADFFKK